jgi:transcriptional regulator with XRE-family HTH domain
VVKGSSRKVGSASVQVVLEQIKALGITKSELARRLGVSQDYIYRILNGRSPFPRARELVERLAEVCQVDPYAFGEYRHHDEALPASTRMLWERMRERGISRDDLFQALDGRISRPYFNSILRGDQPFPTNRAFIQLFALALGLPPTAFREFGPRAAPRWTPEQIAEQEERTFALFFDKMMADYGYARHPVSFQTLDAAKVRAFFLPREAVPTDIAEILARMGELDMGFKELERVSGLAREPLLALFTGVKRDKRRAADVEAIRKALRLA